tara:strand:- start:1299 stop:2255 length:957 start_codon:yes stop_codon:yes gene_type:complete
MKKNSTIVYINIPTFNNEKTIKQSLYSILNQTYKNIRIKVIDNGSTDKTLLRIKEIKSKKISVIKNNSKKGMYNLAKAYESKKDYLCVYHSDDIYHKKIVEEQIKYLKKNKEVILVSTKANIINENNKVIGKTNKNLQKFLFKNQYEILRIIFKQYNIINCPTVMLNNKLLKSKKKIRWDVKNYGNSADLNFYLQILKFGNIKILNKYLCSIRVTKEQITNHERVKISKSDFLKVIENYVKKREIRKKLDIDDKANLDVLRYRDQIRIIKNHYDKKEYKKLKIKVKKINFLRFIKLFQLSRRYLYTLLLISYFKILYI